MLCLKVVFPSKKLLVEEVLLASTGNTLATYVQPTLTTCIFWSMDVYKGTWNVYYHCQSFMKQLGAQTCDVCLFVGL
jgi:hypothetical protein